MPTILRQTPLHMLSLNKVLHSLHLKHLDPSLLVTTKLSSPEPQLAPRPLFSFRTPRSNLSEASLSSLAQERALTRGVLIGASGLSLVPMVAQAAQDVAPQANRAPRPIVYVGMNPGSAFEVANLKGKVGDGAVTYLSPSKTADSLSHLGKTYDLTKADDRLGFAKALGLPADRAAALAEILEGTDDGARDEAAQLARVFREAEQGSRMIERIVLSGHSVGDGVYGDGNGKLKLETIGKLTMLFPKAAAQVQDLMMAACNSGGQSSMDTYRAMFPNLKTVWAYDGWAPGAASGAVAHILRWEGSTRGEGTDAIKRSLAAGTRKGENVAVWSVTSGYDNGQPQASIESMRETYTSTKSVIPDFVSGAKIVDNPMSGELRVHYNAIQRLLGRTDLPAAERAQLQTERDYLIRVLYYKNIGSMFQATFGQNVSSAYQELGLSAPNFATLPRKEALAKIAELDQKLASKPNASAATKAMAERLHDMLRDLKASAIPTTWL